MPIVKVGYDGMADKYILMWQDENTVSSIMLTESEAAQVAELLVNKHLHGPEKFIRLKGPTFLGG